MRVRRMAGEIVDRLADNEYTRGWERLVSDVLRPADRRLASDREMRSALAVPFGEAYGARERGGDGFDVQAQLRTLDPGGELGLLRRLDEKGAQAVGVLMDRAAERGVRMSVEEAAQALFRDSLSRGVGREALTAGMKAHGPHRPVTGAGQVVHGVLGNPAAAYGVPAAVAGLGVAGVMAWQQQQEQQMQQRQVLPM